MLTGILIAVAMACSLLDASLPAATRMRKHAAMGRWIYNRFGPGADIAGNVNSLTLDTFYADGRVVGIFWPRACLVVPMPPALTERMADVVVLWNREDTAHEYLAEIQRRCAYYGYRRVDQEKLPAGPDELMVFLRD